MSKIAKKNKGLILVLSGPSGSGKTTLLRELLKRRILGKKISRSISLTTRSKRTGERNGRDYFFVTEDEFKERLKKKKILEWTRYLGYYYATPRDFIEKQLKSGKYVGLCLDFKGALKLKRFYPENTMTIFVMPPSLETLQHRIQKRCSKTRIEEVKKRLFLAKRELLLADKYDYCIINNDLEQAVNTLKDIVIGEILSNVREAK